MVLGGHLRLLKWARENGYPWNKDTTTGAARRGHLEVLKWSTMNRCFKTMYYIVIEGYDSTTHDIFWIYRVLFSGSDLFYLLNLQVIPY